MKNGPQGVSLGEEMPESAALAETARQGVSSYSGFITKTRLLDSVEVYISSYVTSFILSRKLSYLPERSIQLC